MSEDRVKEATYNNINIKFYDTYTTDTEVKNHVYIVNGKELPSVTQLLTSQNIAGTFPEDNENVIKARERGTFVHADIEKTIKDPNHVPLTTEALWIKENILPNFKNFRTEVLLCTEDYAGQADLVVDTLDDEFVVIIDHKSGSYDKNVVSWQEKMYREGLVYCNLIDSNKKVLYFVADVKEKLKDCKLVALEETPTVEFNRLIYSVRNGKTYQKPFFDLYVQNLSTKGEEADLECFLALLDRIPKTLQYALAKKIAKRVEDWDEQIKKTLIENNQKIGKTADGCTWELGERSDSRLDVKALKENEPEIYNKYFITRTIKVLRFKGHPLFDKRLKAPQGMKEIAND